MRSYLFFAATVLALFTIIGCGKGGATEEVTYINLRPTDTQVLTNPNPTFRFERNTNDTSSAFSCSNSTNALHDVQLKVIKIDAQTSDATVVIDEILQVPNECQFEIQFPSLTLEENRGYAWRVGEPNVAENAQTEWNSFLYSTISMGTEDGDPHTCENNMVNDWTFTTYKNYWQTTDTDHFSTVLPAIHIHSGHDDNGSAALSNPNTVIYQTLARPIEKGKYYQLKFSLKHQGKTDFQIKALAFNGTLDDLQPDANTSIIAVTGTMTYTGNWVKVTLNPWKANKDFSRLAIAVFNEDNTTINALIDRVCLVETTGGGCGEVYNIENPIFDANTPGAVITPFDYVVGAVNDLYPGYDTSVSNWYAEANNISMECATIGDGIPSGEQEEIIAELETAYSNAEENRTTNDAFIEEQNITTDVSSDTNMAAIGSSYFEKCTDKIVDTSKPFSGRDIVYVHGLQRDVIDARKDPDSHSFAGNWPANRSDFYAGGEYHNKSTAYWSDHIYEMLYTNGSTRPSNSYLVVTWPTAQRLPYAVNSIMHQIRDAMRNNNSGVVSSENGKNQCFGDNGIVLISHSTGGMVVSTMFGLIERDKNDTNSIYYTDAHFRDSLDLHVAINPAIGGSAVASAGLLTDMRQTFNTLDSIMVDLGVPHIVKYWQNIMEMGRKPTLLLIGGMTGAENEAQSDVKRTVGGILLRGYKDGVVPSWSQAANKEFLPSFTVKNPLKLLDLGNNFLRSATVAVQSRFSATSGTRKYFVNPYLSPMGMYQGNSIYSAHYGYLKNHYPFIQVAGDHFDNVDRIRRNGKNSYNIISNPLYNNQEESSVTHRNNAGESVFSLGLVSPQYASQQMESVRGKWIGLDLPRLTWVHKVIRIKISHFITISVSMYVPKITWYYKQFTIWQRTYHLLNGYKTKRGADYIYQYILRP